MIDENDPVIQETLRNAEWVEYQKATNTHPCFKGLFMKYGKDVYELGKMLSRGNQCHFIVKEVVHKHQSRAGIEAIDLIARQMAELIGLRLEQLGVSMQTLIDCTEEGMRIAQENSQGHAVPPSERRIIVPH